MLPTANVLSFIAAEAKGALAILTGNRDLWSDALALWLQVRPSKRVHKLAMAVTPGLNR